MRWSQPRLPTCRAGFELSRCVADADHEFAAVSIPRRTLPAKSASPFGDRARRLAWPARGTERFLGRCVSKYPLRVKRQCRRRVGTHVGLIPYSCLVPPRFFPLVRKTPQSGRRCLNHPGAEDRRLLNVRNKTEANDYDVQKLQNGRPWKERTYILRGQITVRRLQHLRVLFGLGGSLRSDQRELR